MLTPPSHINSNTIQCNQHPGRGRPHNVNNHNTFQGIDNRQIVDVSIIEAGAFFCAQRGDTIIIIHQYSHIGNSKNIHCCGQLEMFENEVSDKSIKIDMVQH